MKTRITTKVVAASMGLFLTLACAQTRPLTAELMSKEPQISSLNISPKGMQFAAWTNRGDSNVLIARSVSGGAKARALLAIDSKGVTLNWYAWVSEERLLASVTYPTHGAGRMTHLLSIPADGSPLLDLISPKTMGATGSLGTGSDYIVDWMPEDGQHVLVQLSGLNATNFPDVYEFDLRTGEHQVRHKAQRYTQSWLTDRSHRIRVAIRVQDEKVDVQVSDEQGLNWRSAWSYAEKDRTGLIPLGFGSDPNLLYVNAILDGRRAIFEVDLRDPGLKLIPRLSSLSKDIFGSLVVDGKTGRAVGVRNLEDSSSSYWDEEYRMLSAAIDKALPDTRNQLLSWSNDQRRYLVRSFSGAKPASFFLGDRNNGTLAFLADTRPDLAELRLQQPTELRIPSRDGSEIAATLTQPQSGSKRSWPTVLIPQGPAHERQVFNGFAQLLASKGIAVLELGARDYLALDPVKARLGYKLWFSQGYEDLADAGRWLAQQGIADPARICLAAEGYGAQAALLAAAKSAEVFKCVAAWNGITDLLRWGAAFSDGSSNEKSTEEWLGSVRWEDDRLNELSPVRFAKDIRASVFLGVEEQLSELQIRQTQSMDSALRSVGANVELSRVEFEKDLKPAVLQFQRRLKHTQTMQSFLLEQLKPGSDEPSTAIPKP